MLLSPFKGKHDAQNGSINPDTIQNWSDGKSSCRQGLDIEPLSQVYALAIKL